MATYNSVPLGQSGTGSAFVLGGSQAANQLQDTLMYNQQIAAQQERLRQQQAQKIAQDWQQNALKVDGGLYWQPEFNKRYQDHLSKGIELRQMGINPFNYNPSDPNQAEASQQYLLERQGILADTANRKATEAELKKSFDLIRKDPSKYYASDIEKLNQFVNTPYNEAMGMDIPTLSERFDPNVVLSKITPAQVGSELVVGNKRIKSVKGLPQETRNAIVSAYKNDQNTARWVDELTGRQGFDIATLESIPNTRDAVKSQLEAQYNGNPELRTQLATQGILPGTDQYKRLINEETERLYDAKSKWNNQIQSDLSQVLPKVKEMSSILPDYSAQREADRRQGVAQRNTRFNERGDANNQATFWQQVTNDILDEVPNSGEYLTDKVKSSIDKNGQSLDGRIEFNRNINTGERTITIPKVIKQKTTTSVSSNSKEPVTKTTVEVVRPEQKFTYNPKDREDAARKITNVLNTYTDEKEPYRKQFTESGKGKVESGRGSDQLKNTATGNFRRTITTQELKSRAAASGYSVAEYEKLLKSKGVKIQ